MKSLMEFYEENIKGTWDKNRILSLETTPDPNNFITGVGKLIELLNTIYEESQKPVQDDEFDKLMELIAEKKRMREKGATHNRIKSLLDMKLNTAKKPCIIIPLFPRDPK